MRVIKDAYILVVDECGPEASELADNAFESIKAISNGHCHGALFFADRVELDSDEVAEETRLIWNDDDL